MKCYGVMKMKLNLETSEQGIELTIESYPRCARLAATWRPTTVHPQREGNLALTLSGLGVSMSIDSIPRMKPLASLLLRWKEFSTKEITSISDGLPW